eukprot:CAMPEP_0184697718 /NCGR_PEP_ID=MMETSP0313-20130426/4591_1 /TAXON_ID=2792 /ORGANISM="Porphyridium aerugineum, Strain SAG 1380-2" /LENGTH=629 /DNA_ID=CAMNT_0027156551 /DNA_START=358 /DNA_END=2247 /DNA_ORIENTATION=+
MASNASQAPSSRPSFHSYINASTAVATGNPNPNLNPNSNGYVNGNINIKANSTSLPTPNASLRKPALDYNKLFSNYANDGQFSELKLLYEQNKQTIDVNWKNTDYDSNTSLMRAARYGHEDIVSWLLENTNANVNSKNQYGQTALIEAACNGHGEVMQVLLDHGASINERDNDGDAALHYAAKWGEAKAVQVLLDNGADVSMRGYQGKTAIEWARERKQNTCMGSILANVPGIVAKNKVDLWNRVSSNERQAYTDFWNEADRDKNGRLDTEESLDWFKKSRLPDNITNEVWRLTSEGKNYLTMCGFGLALRYIALAQDNRPLKKDVAMNVKEQLVPCFVFLTPDPSERLSKPAPLVSIPVPASGPVSQILSPRFESMPMEAWTVDDVCTFFSGLGAQEEHLVEVRAQVMDGEALSDTDPVELEQKLHIPLGIVKKYTKWISLKRSRSPRQQRPERTGSLQRRGTSTTESVSSPRTGSPDQIHLERYPMDKWTVCDVCALFQELGAEPEDVEIIKTARISGKALVLMSDDDLRIELRLPIGIRKAYKGWLDKRRSPDSLEEYLDDRVAEGSQVKGIMERLSGMSIHSLEDLLEAQYVRSSQPALQDLEKEYPGVLTDLPALLHDTMILPC